MFAPCQVHALRAKGRFGLATNRKPNSLTGEQVARRLQSATLDAGLLKRIAESEDEFEVFDGGLAIDGNLEVGPRSVVVFGDLAVTGAIIDTRDADYTLLVVVGDVNAQSIATLAEIVITGTLRADVVYGNSLFDYALTVGDTLEARAVINDGHHVKAQNWRVPYRATAHVSATLPDARFDTESLRGLLVAGVLNASKQGVDLPAMVKALRAGADVIRAKVTAPRAPKPKTTSPRKLDVSSSGLTELLLEEIAELRTVDARSNRLTRLPEALTRAEKLTSLTVQYNTLEALPDDIGALKKLKTLDVSANRLRALPPSLAKLTKLTTLHVGNQKPDGTKRMPDNAELIGELTQLEYLGLNDLELKTLPAFVTRLSNLTWIDLSWNPLTSLPEEFFALTKLRYFKFNYTATHPLVLQVLERIPGCSFMF